MQTTILASDFAVRIDGVELSAPLDDKIFDAVRDLWMRYKVAVIPGHLIYQDASACAHSQDVLSGNYPRTHATTGANPVVHRGSPLDNPPVQTAHARTTRMLLSLLWSPALEAAASQVIEAVRLRVLVYQKKPKTPSRGYRCSYFRFKSKFRLDANLILWYNLVVCRRWRLFLC